MEKIIIANWKMFKTKAEIKNFKNEFFKLIKKNKMTTRYGIAVPHIYLEYAKKLFSKDKNCIILAQDCHFENQGAFTGNISWLQLKDINIHGSIIGHSERRQMFAENDQIVNKKNKALLSNDMWSIVCVGESLEEYEKNKSLEIVINQVKNSLKDISKEEIFKMIIAYEPVWAIGTGKIPKVDSVDNLIQKIRDELLHLYDQEISNSTIILYGGSVNSTNIVDFISTKNINGALVGSASLEPSNFFSLIKSTI